MKVPDSENQVAEATLKIITAELSSNIESQKVNLGTAEIRISKDSLKEVMLNLNQKNGFNYFVNVTAVDYMDSDFMPGVGDERFELIYHLMNTTTKARLRIKLAISEVAPGEDLEVDTVSDIWPGANFMESEVYDMYGIKFKGHPNLRRILMYDEFKGYPLRKDYPIQGKQPRVKLISPEVHNTARDMIRPNLVKINKK